MTNTIKYTGTTLTQKQGNLQPYIPSSELINAVNLALMLNRPLLLMGEPGCGKTQLATAVAYELHGKKYKDHYFEWNIKSTSKALEGIYQVNYMQRLYDANLKSESKDLTISNYINYGQMYNAHNEADNNGVPNILLIDEIDKADIDFPNDLLLELDKKEFFIPELGKDHDRIKAKSNVLVLITSNQEKELPAAFLRRCLFHYIQFPNDKQLENIIESRFDENDKELRVKVVKAFIGARQNIEGTNKKPSTSELIDWYEILAYSEALKSKSNLSAEEKYFVEQYELLGTEKIPFKQILIKNYNAYWTDSDE
jgi:MoxR-like ATPase